MRQQGHKLVTMIYFVQGRAQGQLQQRSLEDARYTVYDDGREEIITYVSRYYMQGQSNKGRPTPNKAVKSSRLYMLNTRIHMIKQYKRGLSHDERY